MHLGRAALALFAVGLLLLPGVAYASAFDAFTGPDHTRSPTGYQAPEIDASNDSHLADRYGSAVTLSVQRLTYRHAEDEYRDRNETYEVLREPIETGNATTDSPAVRADLRTVERDSAFVTLRYDTISDVRLSADGDVARVRAIQANDSAVAAAVRDRLVVDYESLSAGDRRTFEEIRNATVSEEAYDYRPWSDEPMVRTPYIVHRDGTYSAVYGSSATDDFGSPSPFVGLLISAVGAFALVLGSIVGLLALVRARL